MAFKTVLQTIQQIHPITAQAWAALSALMQPVQLNRNDFLVRQGKRVNYCYLLTEGVVRVFYSNEGKEYNKTFQFSPAGTRRFPQREARNASGVVS